MDCVDLRPIAKANRWKWHFEESWKAEKDPAARAEGSWYVELLCKRGLIYPAGGSDLLAYVPRHELLRQLLEIGPVVKIHQEGDREAVVRFDVSLLEQVAVVLRPKRLRPAGTAPSPEARAKGLAAIRQKLGGDV